MDILTTRLAVLEVGFRHKINTIASVGYYPGTVFLGFFNPVDKH